MWCLQRSSCSDSFSRFAKSGSSPDAALGLGAAVKWTPALVVAALGLWLLTTGRPRLAAAHLAGSVVIFLALNAPFLVWSPDEVLDAYTSQGARGIIGESLPYVPLRALGLTQSVLPWHAADVPHRAYPAAIAIQALAVLATFGAVVATRRDARAAFAIAAMTPSSSSSSIVSSAAVPHRAPRRLGRCGIPAGEDAG